MSVYWQKGIPWYGHGRRLQYTIKVYCIMFSHLYTPYWYLPLSLCTVTVYNHGFDRKPVPLTHTTLPRLTKDHVWVQRYVMGAHWTSSCGQCDTQWEPLWQFTNPDISSMRAINNHDLQKIIYKPLHLGFCPSHCESQKTKKCWNINN